jgi:hypothetical protein
MQGSWVNAKYSIHRVLDTPSTTSSQDRLSSAPRQSFISLCSPYCTQLSTFSRLQVTQSRKFQLPLFLPTSRSTASRLITSKSSSNLNWSWPPSASPNWLGLVLATGPGNPPAVQVWTAKPVRSVPEPSKNPTRRLLAGQTRTHTRQPTGFAAFGLTRRFQSPDLHFGFHIYGRIQICYWQS